MSFTGVHTKYLQWVPQNLPVHALHHSSLSLTKIFLATVTEEFANSDFYRKSSSNGTLQRKRTCFVGTHVRTKQVYAVTDRQNFFSIKQGWIWRTLVLSLMAQIAIFAVNSRRKWSDLEKKSHPSTDQLFLEMVLISVVALHDRYLRHRSHHALIFTPDCSSVFCNT